MNNIEMEQDKATNAHKRRKIDWNGVIIKELRKVFKSSHLKPMKIISPHGKEENAPWRDWFAVAYTKGIHTQLPEEILRKALERFPVPPQNGRQEVGEQVMFDQPPNSYVSLLMDATQPSPQPTALSYLPGAIATPDPLHGMLPNNSKQRYNLILSQSHPPPLPASVVYPADNMSSSLEGTYYHPGEYVPTTTPVASSNPSIFVPSPETHVTSPVQPAPNYSQPSTPEDVRGLPASPASPLDAAIDYLTSGKDVEFKLPHLEAMPLAQRYSDPSLLSLVAPHTSPGIRSRNSTHSWPSDFGKSSSLGDDYDSHDFPPTRVPTVSQHVVLPPTIPSLVDSITKPEPMERDETVYAKHKHEVFSPTSLGARLSNGYGNGIHTDGLPVFAVAKVKTEHIDAGSIKVEAIEATRMRVTEFTNYSDIRLKEEVELFEDGMEVVRKLTPSTFRWKKNAHEIATGQVPMPDATPPLNGTPSTKSITMANTKANTNIPANVTKEGEQHVPTSKENAPHVNFNVESNYQQLRSSTPTAPCPPSPFIRTSSVPASLHAPPAAPPIAVRTYSEHHLYSYLQNRHYNAYAYYDDEEKYNSDYEVSDDSDDEESSKEDDGDGDDEQEPTETKPKTIGFIAQNVQSAHPNLVREDPKSGILSLDPVGLISAVVGAVKDLDLRTTKLESKAATPLLVPHARPPVSFVPATPISPVSIVHPTPQPPIHPTCTYGVMNLCSLGDGYLVINPKALDFLRVQSKVSILAVCGPKKTGKSLFCNMFLPRDCTEKFHVSTALNDPKGLWMYNATIKDRTGEKSYLVVDSTGIDYNDNNVDKMVTLIWLISSVVVFKDYRNLDIQKFAIFRSVRNIAQRITEEHEAPALVGLIDDDLKIPDAQKYMTSLVNDKKYAEICEAVRNCFLFRTVMQLAPPKVYELESKDFYSGSFYSSFETVKAKLESYLLNFTLGGKDAAGHEFAKYFLQSVHLLNNP